MYLPLYTPPETCTQYQLLLIGAVRRQQALEDIRRSSGHVHSMSATINRLYANERFSGVLAVIREHTLLMDQLKRTNKNNS